ncbi:MAG: hypothetical protein KatS3mg123_1132 [Burkholderiales bacterium]|nr:MAG: hypothetical protein KatS3mg123_1132 [Burkholderiales bacterium]
MNPADLDRADVSGVYRVADPAALPRLLSAAHERGYRVCTLDLDGVATKEELLSRAAQALQFPSYFGGNWDAFEECVNDLAWLPARGYVLHVIRPEGLARQAPETFTTLLGILQEAAGQWKAAGTPFVVLVEDGGNFTFGPGISPI